MLSFYNYLRNFPVVGPSIKLTLYKGFLRASRRIFVKLFVMLTFVLYLIIIILRNCMPFIYLPNLIVTCRTLSFLGTFYLCIWSNSASGISFPIFSYKSSLLIWSLFFPLFSVGPLIDKQFLLECCSYLFTPTLKYLMLTDVYLICFGRSLIIFSFLLFGPTSYGGSYEITLACLSVCPSVWHFCHKLVIIFFWFFAQW